jgi:hypothetical protein
LSPKLSPVLKCIWAGSTIAALTQIGLSLQAYQVEAGIVRAMTKAKQLLTFQTHPILWAAGFVTVNEAAKILSCSLRTLRYRQAQGGMPPRHRRGRIMIYRRADIVKLLRERR